MEVMNGAPITEVEEWKEHMKEEMKIKDAKISSLEEALANNRELTNIIKVEKESLELDNNEKINKIDELENMAVKFKHAFVNLTSQMNELKSSKTDEGNVKDLKKQVKELNKELNDSKEKKNEALKKVKEETNKRAKLEADNTALRR